MRNIDDMIIITKTVVHVKKGCESMHYTLFEELKKYYAAHPEKLDSLTREEFENVVSCEKEENEYGSYDGVIDFGSDRRALCV